MYKIRASYEFIVLLIVFLLVFMAASVWGVNQYTRLYFENRDLRAKIAGLSRALNEYDHQSQVLSQYQQLVHELGKVDRRESGGKTDGSATQEAVATPLAADKPPEPAAAEIAAREPNDPEVDAIRFSLTPDAGNTSVRYEFNLRKIAQGAEPVSGYLFVVLTRGDATPPTLVPYPDVPLKDGVPTDVKRGTRFSIRHGKMVQGKIDGLEEAAKFDKAWVLAFDEDGRIIMKKLLPPKGD